MSRAKTAGIKSAKATGPLSSSRWRAHRPTGLYLACKPWLDALAVVLLSPVLVPLFCVIWSLVRVIEGGPALLAQTRIGKDGAPFTLYKFRTMRAGRNGSQSLVQAACTEPGDQRVTALGRVLRRHRLDEIPQCFNVLRGDMSLIGPRPDMPALAQFYADRLPQYDQRQRIRPGITGWAQIQLGHVTDVHDIRVRLGHDIDYLKRMSVWLDVVIAVKTVRVILSGFGAR